MNDNNELRIIFRPTKEMNIRIQDLLDKGRFRNRSDLIRNAVWLGLNKLEGE